MTFLSATASLTPMLSVILVRRGTCMGDVYPNCFISSGATFSRYCCWSRAIIYSLGRLDFSATGLEHANPRAIGLQLDADAISLARSSIENRHIGLMNRHGLLDDTTRRTLHGIRLDMLLDEVDAINDHMRVVFAQRNRAALAFVAPGEHNDFVALANLVHRTVLRELQEPGTRSS